MNIGYDAKRIFHNTTGLGNYSRDLVRILSASYPSNRYFLYNPKPAKVQRLVPDGKIVIEKKPHTYIGRLASSFWRSKLIVKQLLNDKIDIFHGLTGELPFGIEKTHIKTILTIHDLIYFRFPELYNPIDRIIYLHKLKHAVKIADVIVAISEQTKSDIVEFLNVNPNRIQVIYQGCHQVFKEPITNSFQNEVIRKYHLPENYILNVGAIIERKNVLSLIKAIEHTEEKLVIVGSGSKYAPKVKKYVKEQALSNRVFFLNGLTMKEVAALYRKASVFVYPSIFEGFGIPIIEALYSKTPVITSNGSCFPEAGGPNSVYVDPKNIKEITTAIEKVLSEKVHKERMITKGFEYVQRFNDNVISEQFMNLYQAEYRDNTTQSSINILHVSSPIAWRGGERQIANLLSTIDPTNINQILLCPKNSALSEFCKENKLKYHTLEKASGFSLTWAKKIKQICLEHHISYVHVHDSKSHTYAVTAASLFNNYPEIIVSRRVLFPIKNKWFTNFKYTHPKIDTIICISKSVESIVLERFPEASTTIIPSCIDTNKSFESENTNLRKSYHLSKETSLIGYVAALSKEKDHFTFIETAELILKEKPDSAFFIIGEGSEKKLIEQEIKERQLEEKIMLTGFFKNINSIIPQLDLLLFTSSSEGLGSTILDFFLAKIPVVTTRCGGVEEIVIHNKTGLLSNVGDSSDLSKNVLLLLSNVALKNRITENAYKYIINNHTLGHLANKTSEVYMNASIKNTGSIEQSRTEIAKQSIVNKITAIIPTYNEEHNIDEVIESVLFADEIMIVDSYSTDKTVELARKYTDFILQRKYDYSASHKNWAIPQANNEWILLVDADERVTPELEKEIKSVLKTEPSEAGFWIYRENLFMGRKMNHSGLNTDKVIRLFKKSECAYIDKHVHEEIITKGKVGFLKNKLTHNTYITLDKHLEKKNQYAWWSAKDHIKKSSRINFYHIGIKPSWRFFKHYILQLGFLDGFPGLAYAYIESYSVFTRYIKIWLLKNGRDEERKKRVDNE